MPRVVACLVCNKIERIVDPPEGVPMVPATVTWLEDGKERSYTFQDEETGLNAMVPEYDPVLEDLVGRHKHNRPDTDAFHYIKVWETDQATWDSMDVVENIKRELQENHNIIVEESNYYKEEALKCYNAHGNPDLKDGCVDFLDESKRIGSSKVPKKAKVFLCHMCPYTQSYVAQSLREESGLYDPKTGAKFSRAKSSRVPVPRRKKKSKK